MFCYIFHVFLKQEIDSDFIFKDPIKIKTIQNPNNFYVSRFFYDKKRKNTQKIANENLCEFLKEFKYQIVNNKNPIFKNKFHSQFKKYVKTKELNKNAEQENLQLFYSKKLFEPIINLNNDKIHPNDIYKIEPLNYNKFLNIIIFKGKNTKNENNNINEIDNENEEKYFIDYAVLKSLDEIKHNDNFDDIIYSKNIQLKYLKIITMVYDLIVKYYYVPNDLSEIEKRANNSYWLKKFREREFNNEELKYLTRHISELKDSLFLEDIKRLIEFGFVIEENFDKVSSIKKFISEKNSSIQNDYFDELKTKREKKDIKKKQKKIKK